MKQNVKIAFDAEDQLYLVTVDNVPDIYGAGETEAKAMLDFFSQYVMISENPKWVQRIIEKLKDEIQT